MDGKHPEAVVKLVESSSSCVTFFRSSHRLTYKLRLKIGADDEEKALEAKEILT